MLLELYQDITPRSQTGVTKKSKDEVDFYENSGIIVAYPIDYAAEIIMKIQAGSN